MAIQLNRRGVLIGGAAAAVSCATGLSASATTLEALTSATGLRESVTSFLTQLDERNRRRARFDWNGREWRDWNYFGGGGFIKPGLRLEQMTAAEKDATWDILAQALFPSGLVKAKNVMLLQDILAAAGNGRGRRSSERFSIAVFGSPDPEGMWGVRLEGHHLSLSFSVCDDQIVSVTPAAFAALPNRVLSGRHRGLVTLVGEEKLARQLQADMAPRLQDRAQIRDRHLYNILSSAGRERAYTSKIGVAAADMHESQRQILRQLIETYAVAPYTKALATRQQARLDSSDLAGVHFAWYGPNALETSFGYRIIADTYVIELGCIDQRAQHLHPIYHDLENTLGLPA